MPRTWSFRVWFEVWVVTRAVVCENDDGRVPVPCAAIHARAEIKGRKKMGGIKRRAFLKASAVGGIACTIGSAQREAFPQAAPPRAAAWPNKRFLDLLKVEHPIVQAPMAGHVSPDMPVAVSGAGGLGSFPCAALTPTQVREEVPKIRAGVSKPINLNFFC